MIAINHELKSVAVNGNRLLSPCFPRSSKDSASPFVASIPRLARTSIEEGDRAFPAGLCSTA